MIRSRVAAVVLFLPILSTGLLSQSTDNIRLNQVGFYPGGPKLAIVLRSNAAPLDFFVLSADLKDTVYRGSLGTPKTWSYSNESVSIADFSGCSAPGTYVVAVPTVGTSNPFEVKQYVHQKVGMGALKGFYFARCSYRLYPQYADVWARSAGHPDTSVLIHPSAATAQRPAGARIKAPLGWYDAGDYNKYVVNSGISTYTLLALYEHFPEYCRALTTNIPESGNAIPDVLDEALFNLRWMLAMQDPNDGGVYHKLTNPEFDGWVMPAFATNPRYVVQKSTAASLDLAAVAAQASRIFREYANEFPGFSDSCLQASVSAWNWARTHPATYYNQSQMNLTYTPAINTGEYGDGNVSDEFSWAAAELYVTTRQDSFLTVSNPLTSFTASVPSWPDVNTVGIYSMAENRRNLTPYVDTNIVKSRIVNLANSLRSSMTASAYGVAMGAHQSDFVWGSNGVAANQGMVCLIAYRLTGDIGYLYTAISSLDYLLGRNATTYCFVTGYGDKPTRFPHHRPSQSDGVANPVPGLLAGGPNPDQQDGLTIYPSSLPARSYVDDYRSYASNEICINWNAPLAYLALGIEALMSPDGDPTSVSTGENRQGRPGGFFLEQNYPNPFNPATTIEYTIAGVRSQGPGASEVRLAVYDVLGREVAVLVNERKEPGTYKMDFDGSGLSSGVYVYRLTTGRFVESRKMILMK